MTLMPHPRQPDTPESYIRHHSCRQFQGRGLTEEAVQGNHRRQDHRCKSDHPDQYVVLRVLGVQFRVLGLPQTLELGFQSSIAGINPVENS